MPTQSSHVTMTLVATVNANVWVDYSFVYSFLFIIDIQLYYSWLPTIYTIDLPSYKLSSCNQATSCFWGHSWGLASRGANLAITCVRYRESCHVGNLAKPCHWSVDPSCRGQGLAHEMTCNLSIECRCAFELTSCSMSIPFLLTNRDMVLLALVIVCHDLYMIVVCKKWIEPELRKGILPLQNLDKGCEGTLPCSQWQPRHLCSRSKGSLHYRLVNIHNVKSKLDHETWKHDNNDVASLHLRTLTRPDCLLYHGKPRSKLFEPFRLGIWVPLKLQWPVKYGNGHCMAMDGTFGLQK